MAHQPTHKDKTLRAFRAYIELLDTAEWFKGEVRAPLASFDLTMNEFRVLELLYREGAQFVPELARKRRTHKQRIDEIVERLGKRGWVGRKVVKLPPVEFARAHQAASMRDKPREGRRVSVVGLTRPGKKFFGNVLPSHSKLVKAFMRVLNGTEQESLARLCRKLRQGDVMKFVSEIRMEEVES
jgi:DNA-binding MarR family transcriptional regulator